MPPTSSSSIDGGSDSGTMSTVIADTATGWHVLRISCYSATKASGIKYIKSGKFNVGGHTWYIAYYPAGYNDESVGFISFFLFLHKAAATDAAAVNARYKFSLLDHQGKPDPAYIEDYHQVRSFKPASDFGWGYTKFIKTDARWEGSEHFKNDCFSVRCDVTVILGLRTQTATTQNVAVPSSDLHKHLGELLSKGEGADVTFDVGGELLAAHKYVLAARSSVFMAEMFGPMKEKTAAAPVVISDMEASVFKALLHFIYTDSLPAMEAGQEIVMAQHLLVAADRYDMKRLKSICENKLCSVGVTRGTAMTTLVLAEQHGCRGLKEACFAYLSSLGSVKAVMDTDGYDHLRSSCPSLHDELIAKLDVSKTKKIRSLWCFSVS